MILYFVVNTCIASDNLFATARFPCVNLRITENLPVSSRILPPVKVMFLTLEKLFSKDFPKLPVKQIIKLKIKCQIKNQEPPSPPKNSLVSARLVWQFAGFCLYYITVSVCKHCTKSLHLIMEKRLIQHQ